jgi:hypothetical protein
MTERSCATCRHLTRPEYAIDHTGKLVEPDSSEYRCNVLFVVTRHVWQTPFWPGDIVTWNQMQRYRLDTRPLVILDPHRTETNSAGAVIRAGVEPFSCRAWNVDELEMPDRWKPAAEYDVRWDAFKGRYVRRPERRAA